VVKWVRRHGAGVLGVYEWVHVGWLRERALALVEGLVRAEDDNTFCIGIGPVRAPKRLSLVRTSSMYGLPVSD
jgi:hypothetical protein